MNNTIVKDYDKLIYSIINKYSFFGDIDDLYQVGMMGLLKACEHYDGNFNTKFSTYAHTYILGEVLKYIRDNKVVRINRDLIRLSSRVEKVRERLNQKLMREVTNSEVAHFLGIDEKLVDEAVVSSNFVKSLDYELNDEGRELNLYDSIKYEEKGFNGDLIDLRDSIESLSEEEKKIIQYRYFDDRTQSDVSLELGMSQVQVSRKESKILQKLKKDLVG